jgi:cobalt-zinc-cadmium efflux system membrane fusion protein
MYRRILWLAIAIGIAGTGFLTGYFIRPSPSHGAGKPPAKPSSSLPHVIKIPDEALANMHLKTETVATRALMRQVEVTGIVGFDALHFARITAPAAGRIENIDVGVGDHVTPGQPLAVLNNFALATARSDVNSSQAAVVDARAQLSTADAAMARATYLVSAGGMSKSERDARRAAVASAEATLRTNLSMLQQRKATEARLMPVAANGGSSDGTEGEIVAPFAGVVDSVAVSTGQLVDPSLSAFTLADLSVVWVKLDIPEQEVADIASGDEVEVQVDAFPGRTFKGRVSYIADQVDPNSGTIAIRCIVPNEDGALRVNMFATAVIEVPLGRSAVVVPDSALQTINGKPSIFIPDGKGRFRWEAIQAGLASGGVTEIHDGVPPDTSVVTQGSYWLKAKLLENTISGSG